MNGKIKINRIYKTLAVLALLTISVFAFFELYKINKTLSYDAQEIVGKSEVRLLVVGDVMLDRDVKNKIDKIGFKEFFKGVKDLIQGVDIAVANLEGPFTTYPSITTSLQNKALQFTFDPAFAPMLDDLGFDILGLANNHTLNFGKSGLEQTRRYIGDAGMIYYGEPFNKDEISTVVTRNGIRIAFVGFHEFNYVNFENVFTEIARLRPDVDVLIVTPHWGVEYQKEPTERMSEWAHKFINSGADIVIGTHPHVVGNIEEYKGKKIYYSLGNFVFDQYFSKETMEGLAVMIKIEKENDLSGKQPGKISLDYEDIPIRVDRGWIKVVKP